MKTKIKVGCKKCGRFIETETQSGFFDFGFSFSANSVEDIIGKVCICKEAKNK